MARGVPISIVRFSIAFASGNAQKCQRPEKSPIRHPPARLRVEAVDDNLTKLASGRAYLTATPVHWLIKKYGRKGNLTNWKAQLNGDCPKRDAHSMLERCDLVCPDLPKVL